MAGAQTNGLEQNEQFIRNAYNAALLPCILSILGGNINILADGIIVGQIIGPGGLAAISLSLPIYLAMCIAGSLVVTGSAINASRALGSDLYESSQRYYKNGITLSLILSVLITIAGFIFLRQIIGLLCPDPALFDMVFRYSEIMVAGTLPTIMIYIPFWFLRLDGRGREVICMMFIMGAANITLDIVLMYFLKTGIAGAALASVISSSLSCLYGFAKLCDRKSSFAFGFALPQSWSELSNILYSGSPSAANNLFSTLKTFLINTMLLYYGGGGMVSVFSAVNGIAAFADCVMSGVPQAASPLLGVYCGEKDNKSAAMVLRCAVRRGVRLAAVYGAMIVCGSGLSRKIYGLDESLLVPMIFLALSVFPGLLNCTLISFYNVSKRVHLANLMIVLRVLVFPCISLAILINLNTSPWSFLFFGEALAFCVWYLLTYILSEGSDFITRYLLMDDRLVKEGKVINFSVSDDTESICGASGKISDFCESNGMPSRQVMTVGLAMEEIMVMIASKNESRVAFDLRVFSVDSVSGIRIRYDGKDFNPFAYDPDKDEYDEYMGIAMIKKMVEQTLYQRNFGMNTLLILLKDK